MDPTDYAGNSKKDRENEAKDKGKPEKDIKKVVTQAVTVKKKGFGRRLKDSFIEADVRTVISYIVSEKVIPGAKNIILDSIYNGFEKMFFPGENRRPGGQHSRISYSGISRSIGGSPLRNAPRLERGPRSARQAREEFVIPSKKEAEEILELMNDVIDNYDVVSLADYYEMVDQPISPVDQKWGWAFLGDVGILQVRGGYLIDLPPAEPIQ